VSRRERTTAQLLVPAERVAARSRWLAAILAVLLVAAVAAIAWLELGGEEPAQVQAVPAAPAKAAVRVTTDAAGAAVITLPPALQERNGIETAPLRPAPFQTQVRAYGSVLELGPLTALGNGFANAKAQVAMAEAKLAASKAAFARAQTLYRNQQNVSQADLQLAEAAFRTDQAALDAANAQLSGLTATAVQDWGPTLGKELAEGGPLVAALAARREFLIQVSLSPGTAFAEPPFEAAVLTTTGARVAIRLVSPAPRTDPKIQGVSFLYAAPADSGLLPGMDVLASLPNGRAADGAMVPSSAVVWWQGRAWAYLRTAPDTFTRREIATDLPAPDGGYVLSGLPAGAALVVRGAQALLSEEFRAQIDASD
jgi:multidrug efflux pump subunit AcrA (membrane-fusion protein)